MRNPTDRTLRSPVSIRHEEFGEILMPVLELDDIIRRVRDSISNERNGEGNPVVRCAVRHLYRSFERAAGRDGQTQRPNAEKRLREAVLRVDEYDPRPVEFAYPALHVRGHRGRTHSRDVILQALCKAHRIALPSPPMGIEAVHGDAPAFDKDLPRTAIVGLPEAMPALRFYSWCWTGEGTNVSMRWPCGLEYLAKDSFATLTIPAVVPQTVLGHLVGRKADAIADVPGFERIVIRSAEYDDAGRTIVEGRHDTRIRLAA